MSEDEQAWQSIAVNTQLRLDFANEQVDLLREQLNVVRMTNQAVIEHAALLQRSAESLGQALYAYVDMLRSNETEQEPPTFSTPFLDGSGAGE